MRTTVKISFLLLMLLMGCSGGGTSDDDGGLLDTVDLGSFEGDFQVVNIPQTSLGFITNSKVSFKKIGDTFVMLIIGDDGFNRAYEGKITGEGANSSFLMTLEKQTSPVEKPADGALSIANNIASIEIILEDDEVTLTKIDGNGDTITFDLSGKLRIAENFERNQ